RNARPGLAATDDGEVRAECGERFCRRQPNAIGGTRDQDLLVVHGTAIQGYGSARMTCSMVEDLTIDHGVSEQGLKARTVEVVVKHTNSDRPFQGRGCLRYASKHMHSRARSNQCAPLRGRAGQEGFPTEGCLMVRQTNNDARRETLLRFGHRASASSG